MPYFYFLIAITLFISGCSQSSVYSLAPMENSDLIEHVKKSPIFKSINKKKTTHTTSPQQVALYFKKFNSFNKPSMIQNWEKHYVLGEASSPNYSYTKLAEMEFYMPITNNKRAIEKIKNAVSKFGGDGIIDLYKKPISSYGNKRKFDDGSARTMINTYLYYGVVISKK